MKISYVNGEFLDHSTAKLSLEDRGYLFGDGIYEVIEVVNGVLIDAEGHFARLARSLAGVRISEPLPIPEIERICQDVISRNNTRDNFIYIQVTRGIAKRAHPFPANVAPTLVVYLLDGKKPSAEQYATGVKVITTEETRWKYRNYKTILLLPNILAKQEAMEKGAYEAWFIEDGIVTEGSSTNAFVVKNKIVITHPATNKILGGVTRDSILRLARKAGIQIEERPFTLEEALKADEAFLTSTSSGALAITEIDGKKIAGGNPGEISLKLNELYQNYVHNLAHPSAAA